MITPVLLCGGSGTRLWPLSRRSYPKQFSRLVGDESLFQASARRLCGEGFAPPIAVTSADFRFIVAEQLRTAGVPASRIVLEPVGRNTAPAVLAAAFLLADIDPSTLMLVAPTDHLLPSRQSFLSAVAAGEEAARAGNLVTFGIRPDRPETGYGYLELESAGASGAIMLRRFVEKPDAEQVRRMLDAGNYLWNAGIFLFCVDAIVASFEAHAPDLIGPVRRAVEGSRRDLDFLRLDEAAWAEAENISIDYAVMERADNIVAVPYQGGWSDLGDWDAVWRESPKDDNGVVADGPVTAIDCTDTLLRAVSDDQQLVGLGLDQIAVISMPDAVLVADRRRAQDVRLAVEALTQKCAKQATEFPRDHRPWGWFETLVLADRYQVKRIVVRPGAALSLQSHVHRAEHWTVVTGTARVTIDDDVQLLTENQSTYIPLGAVHRLENPGKVDLELIEVQTGAYLGEDDIVRYDDVYAREDERS